MSYTFLQNYWWFLIALLGGLLVFLMFVQGANLHLGNRTLNDLQKRMILNSTGTELGRLRECCMGILNLWMNIPNGSIVRICSIMRLIPSKQPRWRTETRTRNGITGKCSF